MTLGNLLRKILLIELGEGMWVTLKNHFRPHITVEYPRETLEFSPRFRGVPRLRKDPRTGEELCVSCLLCEAICPTECICIVSENRLHFCARSTTSPVTTTLAMDRGIIQYQLSLMSWS